MKRLNLYISLIVFLVLSACSDGLEIVGSISLNQIGQGELHSKETQIKLEKGDVIELWNDMSIETKQGDKVHIHFGLEQEIDGVPKGGMRLNALKTNPTLFGSKESTRGRLVWSFQGKMAYIEIQESGTYTFRAGLFTSDKQLLINRAKLIFKRKSN